jgi:hypothetical protein
MGNLPDTQREKKQSTIDTALFFDRAPTLNREPTDVTTTIFLAPSKALSGKRSVLVEWRDRSLVESKHAKSFELIKSH